MVYGGTYNEKRITLRYVNDRGNDEETAVTLDYLKKKNTVDLWEAVTDAEVEEVTKQIIDDRIKKIDAVELPEAEKNRAKAAINSVEERKRYEGLARSAIASQRASEKAKADFEEHQKLVHDAFDSIYRKVTGAAGPVSEKKAVVVDDNLCTKMLQMLVVEIRKVEMAKAIEAEIAEETDKINKSKLSDEEKSKAIAALNATEKRNEFAAKITGEGQVEAVVARFKTVFWDYFETFRTAFQAVISAINE